MEGERKKEEEEKKKKRERGGVCNYMKIGFGGVSILMKGV